MVEDLRGTTDCPWINLRFELDAIVQSFESWYTDMRELLDEDIAVQLQSEIGELETKHDSDVAALNQSIANLVVQNQRLQERLGSRLFNAPIIVKKRRLVR